MNLGQELGFTFQYIFFPLQMIVLNKFKFLQTALRTFNCEIYGDHTLLQFSFLYLLVKVHGHHTLFTIFFLLVKVYGHHTLFTIFFLLVKVYGHHTLFTIPFG